MKKIRRGNDFVFAWEIERNGLPENLSSVLEKHLYLSVLGKRVELIEGVDYDITGNVVRIEVTPAIANILGTYKAEFHYILPDNGFIDDDRKCAVDVDAFRIVEKTAQADDSAEFSMTSDMAIALRGKSAYEIALEEGFAGTKEDWLLSLKGDDGTISFEEFTPEQKAELKGEKGDKGEPFEFNDLTPEQKAELKGDKGDKGDTFEFNDLTPEQKAELKGDKGDKGDTFEFNDLTPEQKAELKGDDGESAYEIWLSLGNQGTEQDFIDSLAAGGVDLTSYLKITDAENTYQPKGTYLENETDPTVPEWAKQENKPTYGVNEITGLETALSGKVDNERVLTDVPANAKFTDTTYENATTSISGLMSNTDKSKLDGVEAGANKYVHPAGTNPHGTTKADVGLGNVDNVKQIPFSEKGANNGVAELDSSGKVLSSQLPSYVDDVLEYATSTNFPTTGETGKIYIAINTNLTYRWTGTAYTEISPSIALGETSSTAYRGDRGKIAYDHSQATHAPANAQKNSDITKAEIETKLTGAITTHTHDYAPTSHTHDATDINAGTLAIARIPTGTTASTVALGNHTHSDYVPTSRTIAGKALTANITLAKGDVGLGSVDNTSDANKPVSTAQQTALNAKIDASKFQVVTELPASPVTGVFYFVKE